MQETVADPRLRIHFEKMLELKRWVKEQADESNSMMMHEVHQKLHDLIKEAQ